MLHMHVGSINTMIKALERYAAARITQLDIGGALGGLADRHVAGL